MTATFSLLQNHIFEMGLIRRSDEQRGCFMTLDVGLGFRTTQDTRPFIPVRSQNINIRNKSGRGTHWSVGYIDSFATSRANLELNIPEVYRPWNTAHW